MPYRDGKPGLDFFAILEAMDKVKLGLPGRLHPHENGKKRFALSQSAKAVVMALSPGVPTIERVIIRPWWGGGRAKVLKWRAKVLDFLR